MTNIKCKNCEETIPSKNINMEKTLAKCDACHCVFNFHQQIKTPRPEIGQPDRFEILQLRSSLDINYKWYSPIYIFLAFFALFWNGFLVFWYYTAITGELWFMAMAGILHLGLGIGLIYTVIAGFLNTTHINATKARLKIFHEPLWWRGNRELEVSEIEQFFCKLQINRGKNDTINRNYQLYMLDVTGKQIKLLSNLKTPEEVLYLEQELEKFLEIENKKVAGELKY